MQESYDDLPIPDEIVSLKKRADLMGISYHPSIGVEKLRDKIAVALNPSTAKEEEKEKEAPVAVPVVEKETDGQRRLRKKKEASELIRIRVTCMNPAKKEWAGEIFTVSNATVGTFKKYIPFNADEGWHVPRIIYNQLVARQCQVFVNKKDGRGNTSRTGKLIKEFAIEVMPQLTPEELHDLAQRQAMANSID